MVKIKMGRNRAGSPDGFTVVHYKEGETYDLPKALADLFVNVDKVAEYVEDQKAEKTPKNKAEKVAENKSAA